MKEDTRLQKTNGGPESRLRLLDDRSEDIPSVPEKGIILFRPQRVPHDLGRVRIVRLRPRMGPVLVGADDTPERQIRPWRPPIPALRVLSSPPRRRKFLLRLKNWVRARVRRGLGWIEEEIPLPLEGPLPGLW